MKTINPASLPAISAVEIVSLRNTFADRAGLEMQSAEDAPFVVLENEQAQRIAWLWRQLPSNAEEMRCHTPPYGLRFRNTVGIFLRVSVCWKCNNIYGDSKGEAVHFVFDGSHPKSRLLLEVMRSTIGDPVTFEE